tara:strand:+ start:11309 stop:12715 length:1407 start_codon:yes stop_codon:yes gene_type:complete
MRWFLILSLFFSISSLNAQQKYLLDWHEVGEESIGHLVDLIQIKSINPPGNETEVTDYLSDIFESEGISYKIYALEKSRASIVARIKGNGNKKPILIMGHTDVVDVQEDRWFDDPFSGLRQNGFIYGRGSLDDKDNVTAGLMVLKLLKRFNIKLERDIIFLAESGEEGTPEVGINFLIEKHFEAIDAEYCLAEGGQSIIEDGKVVTVGIATAEKMPRRVTLVARGTPGHGSRPTLENAVVILANAVAKTGNWDTDVRLNETTRAYFQRMAEISPEEDAFRYKNIENPEEAQKVQKYFLENFPYHYSISRTSVVPTVIDAGIRRNVIPSEASAILDIRMLPDENLDEFYEKLKKIIDDPRVEIIPEKIYRPAAPPSKIDNEMFQTLERVAKNMNPYANILPIMITAASDMAQVRAKGMHCYGIGPSRTVEEINSGYGAHGDNERVSEQAFVEMVKFIWNTVIEMAAEKN